jgi:hypothetical protein
LTRDALDKEDLYICSPTVLAFSLGDKFWGDAVPNLMRHARADRCDVGEYAVDVIKSIEWSTLPFDFLTIPAAKKEVVMAITQRHLDRYGNERPVSASEAFDVVVEGKGRGINIILQ